MGQVFLTVYDNKRRPVAAKTLVDAAGNDVINPRTGQPLIVPRDYDVNAAIEFGRSLRLPRLPFNEDLLARELVRTYESMYKAFQHGGAQDLQRSYNGMVGGGADEFAGDFKDAASFNLGVVGRAAGLSPDEIALGGGMFNRWNRLGNPRLDTSGLFFNDPDDFRMIQEGIRGHDSGIFLKRMPSNEQSSDPNKRFIDSELGAVGSGLAGAQEFVGGASLQGPERGLSAMRQTGVPASSIGPPEQPPTSIFADLIPKPAGSQLETAGRSPAYQQVASKGGPGLPQHVIDTGNLLRANGFEITPRTMYVSHVLGPQAAVELFKRTGSTSSPLVPSPDAATGDQMRAWVRALRLGPAAQAGAVGAMAPAPNAGSAPPDELNTGPFDSNQSFV
jgi:hypothetical protein